MEDNEEIGITNPYALAETIAGRRIRWETVKQPERLLEEILQTPYMELFDPKYDSPLFPGASYDAKRKLHSAPTERIRLHEMGIDLGTDEPLPQSIEELQAFLKKHQKDALRLLSLEQPTPRSLEMSIELGKAAKGSISNLDWPDMVGNLVVPGLWSKKLGNKKKEWTPDHIRWEDPGHFFNKAADFFDPVQGSVANCYFIAAMAAVAWTRPYRIAHRTRSIGADQQEFTCMIKFYRAGSSNNKNADTAEVEVTEKLPLNEQTGDVVYCRSSEDGEIWPGVYEKAFAKWITGNTTDKPDITETAWGSPVRAVRQLCNEHNTTNKVTANSTASELYSFVRSHSMSRKTMHPMVASTYSSADDAPDNINYSDGNLAAAHAYAVLGWFWKDDQEYIVLYNPWGRTRDSSLILDGNWMARHVDWWKSISLTEGGVFALTSENFKKYFRRIASVKP